MGDHNPWPARPPPPPPTLYVLALPPSSLSAAVQLFPSEQSLVDYVKSVDYDKQDNEAKTESGTASPNRAVEDDTVEQDVLFQGGTESGDEQEAARVALGSEEVVDGKVGMAVIFNKAPQAGGTRSWDYTLRFNYTYGVSQFEEQVR